MKRIITVTILLSLTIWGYGQDQTPETNYQEIIEIVQTKDTTALQKVLGDRDIRQIEDPNDLPLLFFACSRGDRDMVNFLLAHGSDSNTISGYGTPAHWAAERGHIDIIKILMDKGFNPRIEEMSYWVEKHKSGEQLNPNWMPKLVAKLLEKEIDYRNYPYMEFTSPSDPLLLSAAIVQDKSNKLVLAKELINGGGNVNLVDKRGMTALLWAIQSLNIKAVALLLKHGADVNQPLYSRLFSEISSNPFFDDNLTPLHFLLFQIKQRPEILKTDRAKVLKIVKLLMRNGADPNLKTKNKNQSVRDVAQEIGDPKMVKLLQK